MVDDLSDGVLAVLGILVGWLGAGFAWQIVIKAPTRSVGVLHGLAILAFFGSIAAFLLGLLSLVTAALLAIVVLGLALVLTVCIMKVRVDTERSQLSTEYSDAFAEGERRGYSLGQTTGKLSISEISRRRDQLATEELDQYSASRNELSRGERVAFRRGFASGFGRALRDSSTP